jgi:hypothetical protein
MKLSELIQDAQALLKMEGDLECFSQDDYSISAINIEVSDGRYPSDYEMPDGYRFIRIRDSR